MKPRVIMTTATYRIVQGPYPRSFMVEQADGRDALRQRRWVAFCVATKEEFDSKFHDLVGEIGRALCLRAKRRRKSP